MFKVKKSKVISFIMAQHKQQASLPRFHRDFIGIGHQLEQRRRERRRIELEERAVANRVLFLEKEQFRAQKNLVKKREQLSRMLQIAQRQASQKDAKDRLLLQREKELQMAKEENHLRRIMHRQNLSQSQQEISERNSLDYKMGKMKLIQGESLKRQYQRQELLSRQERYQSLNASREVGRSRIDSFFKKKNKEHLLSYKEKIKKEESSAKQKRDTIDKLTQIQEVMRKRLEESSMRVSQMDQVIGNFSKTVKDKSYSRLSLNQTLDHSPAHEHSPTLITSVEGELLGHHDEPEEKMEPGEEGGVSEGGKVRRRRRNKHANRYKEYQLF